MRLHSIKEFIYSPAKELPSSQAPGSVAMLLALPIQCCKFSKLQRKPTGETREQHN